MYDDINGLIHLSELALKPVHNPAEVVQLGQVVKAKVILIDLPHRKIGLSIKALLAPASSEGGESEDKKDKKPVTYTKPKTYVRPETKAENSADSMEEKADA
jgi:ribosomal protein S1